jgi:lipid-A-disaccharide synthase
MEVEYFGNPLVDQVDSFRKHFEGTAAWKTRRGLDRKPLVALLAGSRVGEIERTLPTMVQLAGEHPGYQWWRGLRPSIRIFIRDI